MVTIKHIAEKAGVSRGTVDRVLNNRGKVAPEKEALVRRIAEELGYQPNIAGKGLAARKKQFRLGFCYLNEEKAPFHTKIYEGAREYARELGQYGVTVSFFPISIENYVHTEWMEEFIRVQSMDGWAMDGLLGNHFAAALKKTGMQDIPLVCFNMDMDSGDRLAFVGCDYEQAGRLACGVAALMTDGKARVGIISQDSGRFSSSHDRILGFEKEMEDNYPEMKIVSKQFTNEDMDQFDFFMKVQKMVEKHEEMDILYLVNPGDYTICQAIWKASEKNRIRIITSDLVLESQRDMVKNGRIAATICQEPEKQGALPLEILFNYIALGIRPEEDWYRTELSVLIRQSV